jgi:hypothetical protein
MVHSADVRSVCIRFGFISNKLEFSIMPLTAPETHDRLNALENKTRRLELLCFAQFVVLMAVGFTAVYNKAVHAQGFENVLHARGLVIEDGAGQTEDPGRCAVPQRSWQIPARLDHDGHGVP